MKFHQLLVLEYLPFFSSILVLIVLVLGIHKSCPALSWTSLVNQIYFAR
jgi:hypothetical protein